MTKNTRFPPKSVNGQFVWFWKVRANITHNGRQFVPLLQRLAVRQRLCVSGFASMSGIPGAVM
ncbi:transposase, partial [Escherichia coli]